MNTISHDEQLHIKRGGVCLLTCRVFPLRVFSGLGNVVPPYGPWTGTPGHISSKHLHSGGGGVEFRTSKRFNDTWHFICKVKLKKAVVHINIGKNLVLLHKLVTFRKPSNTSFIFS